MTHFKLQDFARRLDRWMEYLGCQLKALSEQTGIHRPVIWRWRTGGGYPSFAKADLVLLALGLTVLEFFDETPGERLSRAVEQSGEGTPGGSLSSLPGLRPGDFLCAMNRVPRSALSDPSVDVAPQDLDDDDQCAALVAAPLVGVERYPGVARDGRRRTVVYNLSVVELSMLARQFRPEDITTIGNAWRRLDVKDDG